MANFGPRNKKEKQVFAIEEFRLSVQHLIFRIMEECGMTEAQLAMKLGLSKKKIKQMFSVSWNPSLVKIAKIFHTLSGRRIKINTFISEYEDNDD